MAITKQQYDSHKAGRRQFPTFEEYVAKHEAALKRVAEFDRVVRNVRIDDGQTMGQILWSNRDVERAAVESAVALRCHVIGYRVGSEVYGLVK